MMYIYLVQSNSTRWLPTLHPRFLSTMLDPLCHLMMGHVCKHGFAASNLPEVYAKVGKRGLLHHSLTS